MHKSLKLFMLGVLGLIIVVMYLEYAAPKPLDWTPVYNRTSSLPLGTQVLFEQLESNAQLQLKRNSRPPIESFVTDSLSVQQSFLFINGYLSFSGNELDSLLNWVNSGREAFISTNYAQSLFDTLGLKTTNLLLDSQPTYKPAFGFYTSESEANTYTLKRDNNYYFYFKEADTASTKSLGFLQPEDRVNLRETNFVKVAFGKGHFYIHLAPEAFSNYFILDQDNANYTQQLVSQLDLNLPIVWDSYYKTGRERISSPLYYLLTTPSLKWAYYTLLICLLLFIIFEGKRKQKAIKVIQPLQNKSYEYVQTISGMFLDKKDHKKMAVKLIDLFFSKVRQDYHLPTKEISPSFIQQLAQKANASQDEVKALLKHFDQIKSRQHINKQELIELEQQISKLTNHGNTKRVNTK
jgi:hypothetical protein